MKIIAPASLMHCRATSLTSLFAVWPQLYAAGSQYNAHCTAPYYDFIYARTNS